MLKKITVRYWLVVLLVVMNCDNEPYEGDFITEDNSCQLAMLATAQAANDFLNATDDNFNLLCQAYRNALENEIEICGDLDGALQSRIDDLGNCNNLCPGAIEATQIAQTNYDNATDQNLEELCNLYQNALEYQIEVCGDDGTLQAIIEDLNDCEPAFLETVGNWRLVSWLNDQSLDIDNDGVVTNDYLEEIDCYTNETITFNIDGTGTFFLRSEAEITYTPQTSGGEDFFVNCMSISENRTFTWVQESNNTVIITFNDDNSVRNHFRNADSLFIVYSEGFTATSTVDATSTIVEPVTYIYVKM